MKKKTHVKTTAFLPLFPVSAPFQTPLSLTSTERIEGTYSQYVTVSLRCSFLLTLFLSSGMAFPWAAVLQENVLLSGFATVSLGISLCSGMGIPGSAVLCHSIFSSLSDLGVPCCFSPFLFPLPPSAPHFLPFLGYAFTEAPLALPKGLAVAAVSPLRGWQEPAVPKTGEPHTSSHRGHPAVSALLSLPKPCNTQLIQT